MSDIKPVLIYVKDIVPFKYEAEIPDGGYQAIVAVGKGMYTEPSTLITFENGEWSNLLNSDQVWVRELSVERQEAYTNTNE